MINDFHTKEAESLLAKFRQIENIIGPRTHSPTDGAHCEALLREYLRSIMPIKYSVDTGFLYDGQQTSRQIDILIHDESKLRPLYKFDECVIIHPDSLVAAIEVKKQLNLGALKRTIDLFLENKNVAKDYCGKVFWGIFSFESDVGIANVKTCLEENKYICAIASLAKWCCYRCNKDENVVDYKVNKELNLSLKYFLYPLVRKCVSGDMTGYQGFYSPDPTQ